MRRSPLSGSIDWIWVSAPRCFVGCAEVEDYAQGRIKKHEFTRPEKEDDRTRHVDTLSAHTGPVFLTRRAPKGSRSSRSVSWRASPSTT